MIAALPSYRFDQLMYLGWKCFLPLSLAYLILVSGVLASFNYFPI
jgi:NADH-quinone oxidoreductase subunit H